MKNTVLHCENIIKSYGSGRRRTEVLHGISLSLQKGIFYSLIGKSGSGKSTLLYILGGLLEPDGGKVILDQKSLYEKKKEEREEIRKHHVGFIFQDYQLLPELTVAENIMLPVILDDQKPDLEWVDVILNRLELTGLKDRFPAELSGGEQQRTAIGRAVMRRPSLLLADEPTGNLDQKASGRVLDFLLELKREYQPAILMVTHDLDLARSAEVVFHMEDGTMLGDGNTWENGNASESENTWERKNTLGGGR